MHICSASTEICTPKFTLNLTSLWSSKAPSETNLSLKAFESCRCCKACWGQVPRPTVPWARCLVLEHGAVGPSTQVWGTGDSALGSRGSGARTHAQCPVPGQAGFGAELEYTSSTTGSEGADKLRGESCDLFWNALGGTSTRVPRTSRLGASSRLQELGTPHLCLRGTSVLS